LPPLGDARAAPGAGAASAERALLRLPSRHRIRPWWIVAVLLAAGASAAWYTLLIRHASPPPTGTVTQPLPEFLEHVPDDVRAKMRDQGYGAWARLPSRDAGIDPATKRRLDALGYV